MSFVDISEPLRLKEAEILRTTSCGYMIIHHSGAVGIVLDDESAGDDEAIILTKDLKQGKDLVYSHSPLVNRQLLLQGFHVDLECKVARYRGTTLVDEGDPSSLSFPMLTLEDRKVVEQNYHLLCDASYIKDRIISGVMMGIKKEGQLAGFMGMHAEGAMGMLEILPQFRRQGFASLLEKKYCRYLLNQGRIPYCDIIMDNTPSLALHKKLGFEFEEHSVWWLS